MDHGRKKSQLKKQGKANLTDTLTRFPAAYLMILLLVFLAYGQTLFFSLGKLDETNIILDHLSFLSDFHNVKEALLTNPFFHKGGDFYRPMQNLSFMTDALLCGQNGWAWYLTNILLHGLTCSLLYYLLTLFTGKRSTALLLVLIFALHPLFVQTVAWIPARGDLFLALFTIASFIFFIRFIRSGRLLFLLFNIISFGFALFSKETAVIIPVVLILYYFFLEKEKKVGLVRLAIPFGSYLVIILLFLYLRNEVVGILIHKGQLGILPLLGHLQTIPAFIFKFFLPVGLGPMPAFNAFFTLTGLLLLAGLILIAFRQGREQRYMSLFGFVWFLLFVFPSLIYVNQYGPAAFDYMEHRAYLPLTGILLMLYGFLSSDRYPGGNKNVPVILVFIIIIFGSYTLIYSRNYKTPRSFYDLAVTDNPASAIAWFNRGSVRMNFEKDYAGAIGDYETAMKLYPAYAESYINSGFCKEQLNDLQGAVSDYESAARLRPGWYEPHVDLATVKTKMGLIREAVMEYDTALESSPEFYQGYNERGTLLTELNDYRSAMEDFNHAISLNGKYPEAYFNRGILEYRLQDYNSAMEDYSSAIQLDNRYVEAWVNRGVLKYQHQDFRGSIEDFSRALNIDEKYGEAYLDRGMARYQMKDLKGACEDWESAGQLQIPEAQNLLQQYCRH